MTPVLKPQKAQEQFKVAPAKFNIWLMMIASCMLFAALISAFIVHKPDAAAKNLWTQFDLPVYFTYSLITAVVSSITVFVAWYAARKDELGLNKAMLALTLGLGIVFCVFQYLGWKTLVSQGLTFVNSRPEDISASYVWVITMIHALHVLGGIALLAVTLVQAIQYKVHKKRMTLMSITHTYWHFVGLLWIYLFLFLYFAR